MFFAKMPQVQTVYSFEPFKVRFTRAQKNFALNPSLSDKIRAEQIALAGKNEVVDGRVSKTETIGTSIRGVRGGDAADTIKIREASVVLRPILDQAVEDDLSIVVKLDCEGSEFAIVFR